MEQLSYCPVLTPAGEFTAVFSAGRLVRLLLPAAETRTGDASPVPAGPESRHCRDTACAQIKAQLRAYFQGTLRAFDLDYDLRATDFQRRVLKAVAAVKFGETRSYGEIAAALGAPGAARAVGGANHANPLPLIIPCHRIIGSDGSLTGYGGGLRLKARLLAWEKEVLHAEKNRIDHAGAFNRHLGPERHF